MAKKPSRKPKKPLAADLPAAEEAVKKPAWNGPTPGVRAAAAAPEPPKITQQGLVAAQAPAAAAPAVKVTFVLLDLGAKQVWLCGDFTNWAANATPMKRGAGGHWETTVALAPGRYEYKFRVDGEWIPDPAAQTNVWNHHGTLNSVLEVRA